MTDTGTAATVTSTMPAAVLLPKRLSNAQVTLRYSRADPYAVHVRWRAADGRGASWMFGRDLLVDAFISPAGDGDIRLEPRSFSGMRTDVLRIAGRLAQGSALLQVDATLLAQFLHRTLRACPAGDGSRHVGIDSLLERLRLR